MNISVEFFSERLIEAIDAGIYQISLIKNEKEQPLYIGESVWVLVRCATHLYAMRKEPEHYGFTPEQMQDKSLTIKFTLLELIDDSGKRKKKEKEIISSIKPILQSGVSDRVRGVEAKLDAVRMFIASIKIVQ